MTLVPHTLLYDPQYLGLYQAYGAKVFKDCNLKKHGYTLCPTVF
jgi:hypothetical protein